MSDWMDQYLAGDLAPAPAETIGSADPVLVVGTVLEALAARGVPVVVDHSLECAVEAAGRLLRCLGVEALDPWAVAP
jgi:hypothetical protein